MTLTSTTHRAPVRCLLPRITARTVAYELAAQIHGRMLAREKKESRATSSSEPTSNASTSMQNAQGAHATASALLDPGRTALPMAIAGLIQEKAVSIRRRWTSCRPFSRFSQRGLGWGLRRKLMLQFMLCHGPKYDSVHVFRITLQVEGCHIRVGSSTAHRR